MNDAIICQDLAVRIGSFQLHPLSLHIPTESFQVVLGPTGSGKTLWLEMLAGLCKPDQGQIFARGKDITSLPPERRDLAYLPQDGALFPHLDVEENIYFGLRFRRQRQPAHRERIEELIDWLGIRSLLKRRPEGLSGGEKQRVALIRAIASGTHTLLLDEPTAALHQTLSDEVSLMLRDLQRKLRLTVVMVTHDLSNGYFLADQLSVLIKGRLLQTGSPEEVFRRPATLSVAKFLGYRNLFRARLLASQLVFCPALGYQWPLPQPISQAENDSLGWLGLRADWLHISKAELPTGLAGEIERLLHKADHLEVLIRLKATGERLYGSTARQEIPQRAWREGQAVWVAIDPEAAFWLSDAARGIEPA